MFLLNFAAKLLFNLQLAMYSKNIFIFLYKLGKAYNYKFYIFARIINIFKIIINIKTTLTAT
jgi:hypothetical protein